MKKSAYIQAAIATLLLGTGLTSCGLKVVNKNDGITKAYKISTDFDTIETLACTDVEYTVGPTKIILTAPKEYVDKIVVKVENGKLIVTRTEDDNMNGNDYSVLKVSHPAVSAFLTYGTGDIEISESNVKDLMLGTFGTGDIKCQTIKCTTLTSKSYGTGDIELGRVNCTTANFNTAGTGDIECKNIFADFISANSSGTGDVELKGECRDATTNASGTGDIINKQLKITGTETRQ